MFRSVSGWPSAYAASIRNVGAPFSVGAPFRVGAPFSVGAQHAAPLPAPLPAPLAASPLPSVSTSRQPDRDSILAMRSVGKWGSMGRYTPPALKTASTA